MFMFFILPSHIISVQQVISTYILNCKLLYDIIICFMYYTSQYKCNFDFLCNYSKSNTRNSTICFAFRWLNKKQNAIKLIQMLRNVINVILNVQWSFCSPKVLKDCLMSSLTKQVCNGQTGHRNNLLYSNYGIFFLPVISAPLKVPWSRIDRVIAST